MYRIIDIHAKINHILKNYPQNQVFKQLEILRLEMINYEKVMIQNKLHYLRKQAVVIKSLISRF